MNKFKKCFAIFLALILAIATVPVAFAGDVTPVIMISGFGATTLAIDGEVVFPPALDDLKAALGVEELNIATVSAFIEKWTADKGVRDQLSATIASILEPLRTDENGNSVYNVTPYIEGAEHTSLAAFKAEGNLDYVPYTGSEFLDMESLGQKIGDENVFNFTYDWRLDYNTTADILKEYIDDVLFFTGAEKVSIYAISQGALVVGQYLYKYADLKQTDNIVFDTPVLGGSTMVTDIFTVGECTLNFETVLALVGDILHTEADLSAVSSFISNNETVAAAINYGKDNVVIPPIKTCLAFWEMVPIADFDKVCGSWLDSDENAEVIRKIQDFYGGFMSHITETFEKATAYGSTVSIKACSGTDLVTTSNINSDGIVDMKYSCGATCAEFGTTFPADYTQAVDNGKNSISPDRTVDLSTGYWPQRTWVINGLRHGQIEWCPQSLALVETLLFTHDLADAYSSYEFPQFSETQAPTADLTLYFASTNSGFMPADNLDHTLIIKNTSKETTFKLNSLKTDTLTVSSAKDLLLAPGEAVKLTVKASDCTFDTVTVSYNDILSTEKVLEKTFGVTVTDSYSGVTVADETSESTTPHVLKKILDIFLAIFSKLTSFANLLNIFG